MCVVSAAQGGAVFNPLEHLGLALDRHGRHWHELDVEPVDAQRTDPHTRSRINAMEGLEAADARFDRRFARHVQDPDTRRRVGGLGAAAARRRETLAALRPQVSDALESTAGYERTAVDLLAWVARSEPDAGRAMAYGGQALWHLSCLHGYAELSDRAGYRWLEPIVGDVGALMSGSMVSAAARHHDRPQHAAASAPRAQYLSVLNRWAVQAVRQQVNRHTGDATSGGRADRERYRAADQNRWEQLVIHESATSYLYYSFLAQEADPRVKAMWELHLQMQLAHLQAAADLLRRSRVRDPQEVVGAGLPEPTTFDRNGPYLQALLVTEPGHREPAAGPPDPDGEQLDDDRDIVDLLADQHARIDRSFRRALNASPADRPVALGEPARLVAVHEVIEEEVIHPLARRLDPQGHTADRLFEEEHVISDALTDVVRAGSVRDAGNGVANALHAMMRAHFRDEERYEFARLRRDLPEALLRELADAVDAAVDRARAEPVEPAEPAEPKELRRTAERAREALHPFSRDVLV
jgi:hypothetical protein